MSNIYIQEPPTSGKVLLHTTVGDIDVELWSKEAPKACRNFIQLCMEGYYNGTIFHRVVKGFIVQGGDPEGTGFGGESIYGEHFKNELHSRLRFVRRGLVAMANSGKEDNGSQFFFTLGACPELQNKHTIFAKVAGNTLFNMLKLEDSFVDSDDRPIYPHKILSCKILDNPFEDIVPRVLEKEKPVVEEKVQEKGKKNYSLLSFGEEAEEDEAEVDAIAEEFRRKGKSSHDLTKDPKLSSVPGVTEDEATSAAGSDSSLLESVRQKLKAGSEASKRVPESPVQKDASDSDVDDTRRAIQKEIKEVKNQLRKAEQQKSIEKAESEDSGSKRKHEDPFFMKYDKQLADYKKRKTLIAAKGEEREKQTQAILAKFKDKLSAAGEAHTSTNEPKSSDDTEEMEDDNEWLSHELYFEEDLVVAKDVNVPSADRYDITDPRNPINQRRRHADKKKEIKGIRA